MVWDQTLQAKNKQRMIKEGLKKGDKAFLRLGNNSRNRTLDCLPKDRYSIPSPHVVVHSHL